MRTHTHYLALFLSLSLSVCVCVLRTWVLYSERVHMRLSLQHALTTDDLLPPPADAWSSRVTLVTQQRSHPPTPSGGQGGGRCVGL